MNRGLEKFLRRSLLAVAAAVIAIGMYYSIKDVDSEEIVMGSLTLTDEVEGRNIVFTPWEAKEDDIYYVILPSGYRKREFEAEVSYEDRYYSVYIDDVKYQSGELWTEELGEEVHKIRIEDFLGNTHMQKELQVLVSEEVPAVMVTVEAKEELLSHEEYANKQYVEKGNIVIWDKDGNFVLEQTMERFKVRGNLTSTLPKKPFTFTLQEPEAVLGMPQAQNWHLLANATDGAHIRNKIMLEWADEMSEMYHPSGEFVDLFLNGEYQGLYFLTETIEVGEGRLETGVSNSILAEMELNYRAELEENCVVTGQGHYWVVHNEMPLEEAVLKEVEWYLNDIESALYSENGVSEYSGRKLEELLDFDSWTDTWLLKEISSDHDLGTTSQFGVVEDWENRSILLAGPEWDFDGTLGNGMVPWSKNPRNLVTAIPNTKGIESVSQNKWLAQMYQHKEFQELLIRKFQEEIQPKIERLLTFEIDQYIEQIRRPALLDSVRWLGNGVYSFFETPENFALGEKEDYHKYDVLDCHVKMVKNFLKEKGQFLQELWVEGAEFEVIIEEHNEPGMSLELNNDIYTWIRKDS